MEICRELNDLMEILNAMHEAERADADGKLYKGCLDFEFLKFRIGFADKEATFHTLATYFYAFEGIIEELICTLIEEECLQGEPYESLYKNYRGKGLGERK